MSDLFANVPSVPNGQRPSTVGALRDRAATDALSSPGAAGLPKSEADAAAGVLAVDLLPTSYKQRDVVRKSRLWQLAVVLVFGGVIAGTAVFQYGLRSATRRRVAAVAGPYTDAQQQAQILGHLQESVKTAERTAELYTFLKHPWPRTQVLRAATAPLPTSIRMEELRIVREEVAASETMGPQRNERASKQPAEQTEEQPATAESDLEQLRDECEKRITVVHLTGLTRSGRDLHQYLADVAKSPLIREADLRSLEDAGDEGQADVSRFEVRLEVIPGFGLPGGPVHPAPAGPRLNESRLARMEVEP